MCELLRFSLIRELRLSTIHFHGSAKLDNDKCILISTESSLNERLASGALVIFDSLIDTACQHVDDTVFATCSFFITCHVHAVRP